LDTTTGLLYFSRNVLNFNGSSISIPAVTNARKINLQFWHNMPSPASTDTFYTHSAIPANRFGLIRTVTSGNISTRGSASTQLLLDGVVIANDAVNPSAGTWHSISDTRSIDSQVNTISFGVPDSWDGRLANVQILGASEVLLANYAINEGTGTTIFDSSGNGQNGSLTLGSGNWQLDWVPL
jgi:hypothetical protein